MLIDLGKASVMTQGQLNQLFMEHGSPPFNRINFDVCFPWHTGCPRG